VTTANGCETSDTITVNYDLINLDFGTDSVFCLGQIITLNALTPGASYLWQDGSNSSFFDVTVGGTYSVDVTLNNCFATETIDLSAMDCDVTIALDIPNVFTPNNDGSNDVFIIRNSTGIASMTTTIYNRWGKQIFETNNLLIEWDGKDAADGTYFWTIDYTDDNGEKGSKRGYLTLLK